MPKAEMDKRVNQWLRDAHAMEVQAEEMLRDQASRIESYPEIRELVRKHLVETRSQKERLDACLTRRGVEASGLKDAVGWTAAMVQTIAGAFTGDEIVKSILAAYAFEQGERACYRALSAASEAVGDAETARVCLEIEAEEEAMAGLLWEELPKTVRLHLTRMQASAAEARR